MRFALTKLGSGAVAVGTVLLGFVQVKNDIDSIRPLPPEYYKYLVIAGILLIVIGFLAIVVDYIRFATGLQQAVSQWIGSIPQKIFPGELTPILAAPHDLPKIHAFVVSLLGPDISPLGLMQEWYQKNPEMMWILRYTNSIGEAEWQQMVGCFSIIPLTRSATRAVKQGRLTGSSFRASHILSPKAKLISGVYIGGVVATGLRAQAYILGYMMGQIQPSAAKGIPIYSRPVTRAGLRLLQKYHFVPVKGGKSGIGEVYVLDYDKLVAAQRKRSRAMPTEPSKETLQDTMQT